MKQTVENTGAVLDLISQLSGEKSNFSDELKRRIRNQEIGVEETHYFGVKNISSEGGQIPLIDETSEKVYGTSNISKNKLNKNRAFLGDRIGLFYATGNEATPGGANFENKSFPAALKNAVLEVKQNGKTILERPCGDFSVAVTAQDPEEKYLELRVPMVLADDLDFEINLQFPKGVSMAAGADADSQHLIKWAFLGYSTKIK